MTDRSDRSGRSGLTEPAVLRRFLLPPALRWLPTGLVVPVLVLLPLDRGLELGQLGVAAAMQGFVVFALQGIYRALDSGPLEAWYVDTAHAANPHARIDEGWSARGTVLGLSVAAGALCSGGLIAADPVSGVEALVVRCC